VLMRDQRCHLVAAAKKALRLAREDADGDVPVACLALETATTELQRVEALLAAHRKDDHEQRCLIAKVHSMVLDLADKAKLLPGQTPEMPLKLKSLFAALMFHGDGDHRRGVGFHFSPHIFARPAPDHRHAWVDVELAQVAGRFRSRDPAPGR